MGPSVPCSDERGPIYPPPVHCFSLLRRMKPVRAGAFWVEIALFEGLADMTYVHRFGDEPKFSKVKVTAAGVEVGGKDEVG